MVADIKSSAQEFLKVSTADDVAAKKVMARPFDAQKYRCAEVKLVVFHIDEVRNPLGSIVLRRQ